jgi:hypothetical protein
MTDINQVGEFFGVGALSLIYFGGVVFSVALMRQWNCGTLVTAVVSIVWFVSLPIIGWIVIIPMLDFDA